MKGEFLVIVGCDNPAHRPQAISIEVADSPPNVTSKDLGDEVVRELNSLAEEEMNPHRVRLMRVYAVRVDMDGTPHLQLTYPTLGTERLN